MGKFFGGIALAMCFACSVGCVAVEQSAVVGLEMSPCEPGFEDVVADCGQLQVYENRQTKTGRIIPINFIRVRAKSGVPTTDAVIELTGGPGAAATANAAGLIGISNSLATRDYILVDQRGTGGSNPLDCIKYDFEAEPETFQEMFVFGMMDTGRIRSCMEELEKRADLTQYTTSIIADDVDDLRAALGYETLTLKGGSYGTTLALEYIRRHEPHTRAALLLGALPTTMNQTETIARDMEDMLMVLFDDCEGDVACSAAYPNFRQDFHDVLAQVREAPLEIVIPHPQSGEPTPVVVRYEKLIIAIRYALYSTQLSAGLPIAIDDAKGGDYARLTQFLPQLIVALGNGVHEGMWASVRCAEEFPYLDVARARALSEGTVLGTERLDSGQAICAFWPRGKAAVDFHEPVVSDVPALVISGEVDASTPPIAGTNAAKHLSNGRLVLVPKRSHWGLSGEPCTDGLIDAFIESASVADLDDRCLGDFKRPPFTMADG